MSRAAIVIPFTAGCVRLGNLMNTEIYGIATDAPWGFVFVRDAIIKSTPEALTNILTSSGLIIESAHNQVLLFFTQHAQALSQGVALNDLQEALLQGKFLQQDQNREFISTLVSNKLITINHPTQIYEAIVYFATFAVLMAYYFIHSARKQIISSNLILSITFIVIFSARFLIEFIKNDQVDFEQSMQLNMGQLLSIPFIAVGFVFLYLFFKNRTKSIA